MRCKKVWSGLVLGMWLIGLQWAGAQSVGGQIRPGVSMFSSFSYSGLNLGLTVDVAYKGIQVYAGPKIALSRSYTLANGPWGLACGGNYTFNPGDRLRHSVHFDYFWTYFGRKGYPGDHLHEFFASYGLSYRVVKGFYVGNTLGLGFYEESGWLDLQQTRRHFSGYNGLVKVLLGYEFN